MKVDCYDDYGAPPLVYRRLTALFRLLYWDPAGLGEAVSVMTSRVPQPRAQARYWPVPAQRQPALAEVSAPTP